MAREMTEQEWMDWKNNNRIEIEHKYPEWTDTQVSTYLHGMADIFEGQGLICRPRSARWM